MSVLLVCISEHHVFCISEHHVCVSDAHGAQKRMPDIWNCSATWLLGIKPGFSEEPGTLVPEPSLQALFLHF